MTPKVKIFENVFPDSATGHRTTFHDQIWWKSAVAKLPKGPLDYHTKNLSQPHFAQNGLIAPKILWTLSPLDFGPDRLRFAGLIPKKLIFRPKSNYNIGFQPIISTAAATASVTNHWRRILITKYMHFTTAANICTWYAGILHRDWCYWLQSEDEQYFLYVST